MTIYEIANIPPQKWYCERCNNKTIIYKEWAIMPISRRLISETWVCQNCMYD